MMSVETISRRGFLAAGAVGAAMVGVGGFGAVSRQADAAFVRPPGAESNAQLVAACDRCGRCLQACPYGIVTPVPLAENLVAYGTPTLAFDHRCCDFCMQCVDACPPARSPTAARASATWRCRGGEGRVRGLGLGRLHRVQGRVPGGGRHHAGRPRPAGGASQYCDGCGKCRQCAPRPRCAYDASVEDKGIVVVSRSSEAAQATGAVSSEACVKRTVAVAQANAASPHTKASIPTAPTRREAGA
ncbi:MAG: 4Fe-4S dicluster domain-containing protein [Eggerthellaceae bacterium]